MAMFKRPKRTQADHKTANQKVVPVCGITRPHENCEICGKSTGQPVMARGELKLYHWACAFESVRETREKKRPS